MYRLAHRGVIRLSDNLPITRDMAEWEEYRAWLKTGGVPEPEVFVTPPRWESVHAGKVEVWELAKRRRDELEAFGFTYRGKRIDSNERAVLRINSAALAALAALSAGQPLAFDWTCADGSSLPLDALGLIGLPVALAVSADALHQAGKAFKSRIQAASHISELEEVLADIDAWA